MNQNILIHENDRSVLVAERAMASSDAFDHRLATDVAVAKPGSASIKVLA